MKKGLLILGAACLAVSLAANLLLLRYARTQYLQAGHIRMGVSSPAEPRLLQKSSDDQAPVILFLGDSRARAWPASKAFNATIWNAGVGGETTAQVLSRTAAALETVSPDVVIIQAGFNDLKLIHLTKDPDKLRKSCVASLLEVEHLSKEFGARVVLTSIIPASDPSLGHRILWKGSPNEAIATANRQLTTISDHFFKLPDLTVRGDHQRSYLDDGVHLSAEGYKLLDLALLTYLLDKYFPHSSGQMK